MKKILIVDDNAMVRKLIRNIILSNCNGEDILIFEAEEGREGLDVLGTNQCDLVITDIIMPGMEGIEFIINLKNKFPNIKIIAMTEGMPFYLHMAKNLGVDRTFTKPLNQNQFKDSVFELIENKSEKTQIV